MMEYDSLLSVVIDEKITKYVFSIGYACYYMF